MVFQMLSLSPSRICSEPPPNAMSLMKSYLFTSRVPVSIASGAEAEEHARKRAQALPHIDLASLHSAPSEKLNELVDPSIHDLLVAFQGRCAECTIPRPSPSGVLAHVDEAHELLRAVCHVAPRPV